MGVSKTKEPKKHIRLAQDVIEDLQKHQSGPDSKLSWNGFVNYWIRCQISDRPHKLAIKDGK